MPFCDYCDTEQAGVPNGLGTLYCSSCGMTISELYYDYELVTSSKGPGGLEQDLKEAAKEASYNDMAEATYKKEEAQKLARKQKRQQRASDAKNAVPARTGAKASVGTLNKKFVKQATMLFCVYCESEQAGLPDGRGALYCSYCGLTISEECLVEEVTFSKGSGGLERDLKEAAKAAVAGVASTRGDHGRESGETGIKAAHADVQRRSSRLPIRTKRYPDTDYVH